MEHEKDMALSRFAASVIGENARWAAPWGHCDDVPDHLEELAEKVMGKPVIERLVIAGAMLAAEIDRLSSIAASDKFLAYRKEVTDYFVGVRKVVMQPCHEDAILTMFDSDCSVSWCIQELRDCEFDEAPVIVVPTQGPKAARKKKKRRR